MGFEAVKIFRYLELEYMGAGTVELLTDLPNPPLQVRESHPLRSQPLRAVASIGLSNTTRARVYRARIRPTGAFALYGGRIYTRRIGLNATDWAWVDLPVVVTPDTWTELHLPIEPTAQEYTAIPLAAIERTSDEYSPLQIPIERTPDQLAWAEIPVDE